MQWLHFDLWKIKSRGIIHVQDRLSFLCVLLLVSMVPLRSLWAPDVPLMHFSSQHALPTANVLSAKSPSSLQHKVWRLTYLQCYLMLFVVLFITVSWFSWLHLLVVHSHSTLCYFRPNKLSTRSSTLSDYSSLSDSQFLFGSQFCPENSQPASVPHEFGALSRQPRSSQQNSQDVSQILQNVQLAPYKLRGSINHSKSIVYALCIYYIT